MLLIGATDTRAAPLTRIAGAISLADAPTVIAERRGMFDAHGLRSEVRYHDSGWQSLQRLRNGEADFALMALTPLVLDRLGLAGERDGHTPTILASLTHATRCHAIVTPADGPIRRAPDLADHRLGLARGTQAERAWSLIVRRHGMDAGSVEIAHRPVGALAGALERGEIDAAVLSSPWPARLQARGAALRRVADDVFTTKWVLVARRGASEPARRRAVLAAYRDAIDFIQRHPEDALALYARHAGVSPEDLRGRWNANSYQLSLDWSLVSALQQRLRWARRTQATGRAGIESGVESTRVESVLALLAPDPLRAIAPAVVSVPRPEADPP